MSKTPFILSDVDFSAPAVPAPRSTTGAPKLCAKACTYFTASKKITKKDIDQYKAYFDKYYSNHNLHDDQKILYGIYMNIIKAAPFDLNARTFVDQALLTDVMEYIDDHEDTGFYVTSGKFTEVFRYWEHILSQYGVRKGTATTSETHTVVTGTSMTSSNTQSVASEWAVETGQSVTASAGLDIPFISASVAGTLSRAEKNSGSKTRTTSSEIGLQTSQHIQHTFEFKGPGPGDPDPVDLTWWQLVEKVRLGDVFWFSAGFLDSDAMCPLPSGTLEINFPRTYPNQGGWGELIQQYDVFQLSRG
ncbi:hypothetical protein [Cyanobium sp. NIES-981]|uniref:hypothetical protein n=1 Tax=Cyanobium sp. NIES-981 TaxID=1851505 RepID=UPI0012F79CE3|nr:hypothetical protein [Cyanobium sp. NIES-981]